MTVSVAPVPRKSSWRRLAIGVLLFLAIPLLPQLRAMFPVEQSLLILVAMIATCALVGWRQGGRLSLALLWVALLIVLIAWPAPTPAARAGAFERMWTFGSGSGYASLVRGWTLLIAASFGLTSLFTPAQGFMSRALSTLALAAGIGFVLALVSPGGPTRIAGTMALEYTRRNDESIAGLREAASALPAESMKDSAQGLKDVYQMTEEQVVEISKWSSLVMPALLALESLAAMALGWSLYHRWSNAPIGPTLGRLREFRFNDQLVWGVAVGGSIYLLPAFSEARTAGLNLLVFFGTLYVLRGLGILSWIAKGRIIQLILVFIFSFIVSSVLAYNMGFLIAPAFPVVALAFALGLGDTWLDWRTLFQPKTV